MTHLSPYAEVRKFPHDPKTIVLFWRGWFGTLGPAWYPDSASGRFLRQFIDEAKRLLNLDFKDAVPKLTLESYDKVLLVASEYGYSITSYGGPEDDELIFAHRRKVRENVDGAF